MNSASASEIHRAKAYIERFWASGRMVGNPESDRLPVAGSISEWRHPLTIAGKPEPQLPAAVISLFRIDDLSAADCVAHFGKRCRVALRVCAQNHKVGVHPFCDVSETR